jgi:hypothetical protein
MAFCYYQFQKTAFQTHIDYLSEVSSLNLVLTSNPVFFNLSIITQTTGFNLFSANILFAVATIVGTHLLSLNSNARPLYHRRLIVLPA